MVSEIRSDSFDKKAKNFIIRYGSIVFSLALIPVIAVSFFVVHQKQDLRQHASGPADSLIYPPDETASTPSIATTKEPTTKNGLINIKVLPVGTSTKITIYKNPEGKIVSQQKGEIDGAVIAEGNYTVSFSVAGTKTPMPTSFSIVAGKITEVTADFATGKATVSKK